MKNENDENLLTKKLTGVDIIYKEIPPTTRYPLILYIVTVLSSWTMTGGMIMIGTLILAQPNSISCIDEIYRGNITNVCEMSNSDGGACQVLNYTFENDWQSDTLITKYNIICDGEYCEGIFCELANINSLGLAGFFIGAMTFGQISDRFGRKKTFVFGMFGSALFSIGTAIVAQYSIALFAVGRFLFLLFVHGSTIVTFVYGAEIIHPKWRTTLGIATMCGFQLGYIFHSLLALMVKGWFQQFLVNAAGPVVLLVVLSLLPESFRWYLSSGRTEEGIEALKVYGAKCGVEFDKSTLNQIEVEAEQANQIEKGTVADLFRTRFVTCLTLKIMYLWFFASMGYYFLAWGSIPGSVLVTNAFNGLVEIVMVTPVIATVNRKWCKRNFITALSYGGCGLFLIINSALQHNDLDTAALVTLLLGRGFVWNAFAIIYVYTTELYPTSVRNTAVGVGSMCGRIGGILSPQISKLGSFGGWVPNALVGLLGVIAGLICLSLPDSSKSDLLQTNEDADHFYKKDKQSRKNCI